MDITLKGGNITHDRRLDRIYEHDDRSKNFPATRGIASNPLRGYTWAVPKVLDQGQEGACVGFGFAADGLARPSPIPWINDNYAQEFYLAAQKVDEWEGEDYEGTSVLAGAKVMQSLGFFDEYQWAFSVNDLALAVGYKGPAIIGVNWYEGMMDTDDSGFIHVSGELAGGHCTLIYKVSVRYRYFGIWNSWSPSWGVNGTAKISFDDMARLLTQDELGEACIPVRRHGVKEDSFDPMAPFERLTIGDNIEEI